MRDLTLDELYDSEIKWRYNYDDGISVVSFKKTDADYKHDNLMVYYNSNND